MKTEIVIWATKDGSEVHRIDVTGKTNRQLDRVERGLTINFNFESYYWDYVETEES